MMCKHCKYVLSVDEDYSSSDGVVFIFYGEKDSDNEQYLRRDIFISYDMTDEPAITWYLETWYDEINNYHAEQINKCPYCGRELD